MIRTWLGMYAVAAGAFVLIDFVWLGFIAKPLYAKHMGDMLAPQPNMRAAVLFYAIFVAGLVFFVIALIAAVFGFGGIAAGAVGIAKTLFFIFLILAIVSFIFNGVRGKG